MPTGTGKTAVLMLTAFMQRAKRVLLVTPSRLVRNQIHEEFADLSTLRRIGVVPEDIVRPSVHEVEGRISSLDAWEGLREYDVVVATPNSISPAIEGVAQPPEDLFDLLLVDEAHHSPARTWNEVMRGFPRAKRVLVTATPFRRDRKEIEGRFVYVYPVRRAFEDGVFGRIEYIPVAEVGDVDVLVAKEAERVLRADRDAGLDHFLMVRTDEKKRAKELKDLYAKNTGLNLQQIDSSHSYGHIKRAIKKLREKELDGIICVDMLGEGFDFPNLKIAAIHAPHRSLEITLQFIGRFARTNAPNLGAAKFLAAPSAIEIEAEKLYEEGAVWEDIVPNLSRKRIDEEVFVREAFEQFDEPRETDIDTSDLSLYALKPYSHVKIYKMSGTVNLDVDLVMPSTFSVIYRRDSPTLSSVVFVTKEVVRPKWTPLEQFARVEYDLFIVHYHAKTKLLFINASTKRDELYEHIAQLFSTSKPRILPLDRINNVLSGLEQIQPFNVGMRNRHNANSESYRILTGPSPQKTISRDDGRLYHRGHVFCSAKDNGEPTTIGYSSASKVWSNKTTLIPKFILWCEKLAERIVSSKGVFTGSELDYLTCGRVVDKIPGGVIGANWDHDVYKQPWWIQYKLADGSPFEGQLHEYDLRIDRAESTADRLRVRVEGPELDYQLDFSLGTEEHFVSVDGQPEVTVQRGQRKLPLATYLNYNPPSFFFADFSVLRANEHFVFPADGILPFDIEQIEIVDWEASGVDVICECETAKKSPRSGMVSIHEYLKNALPLSAAEVVFYDHGSGEIADFVCFERHADRIIVRFYHCKGSGDVSPGQRVEDVYEVCGQVVKCLGWINNGTRLFDQIERRRTRRKDSTSVYLKGDKALLADIIRETKFSRTVYEMVVVQPGISRSDLGSKLAEVLSASNDYIKRHCEKLRVLASQ